MDFCYLKKSFGFLLSNCGTVGESYTKEFSKKKVNTYNQEEEEAKK